MAVLLERVLWLVVCREPEGRMKTSTWSRETINRVQKKKPNKNCHRRRGNWQSRRQIRRAVRGKLAATRNRWPPTCSFDCVFWMTHLPWFIYRLFTSFNSISFLGTCFTEFYWVSLSFTGFYLVFLGFTGFYWVLLGSTGFYWVLLGFTGFYWVLLDFTGFHWVLLGFTGFY